MYLRTKKHGAVHFGKWYKLKQKQTVVMKLKLHFLPTSKTASASPPHHIPASAALTLRSVSTSQLTLALIWKRDKHVSTNQVPWHYFWNSFLYSLVLFLLCVATTLHCKEWYDSCTFDVLTRSCQCVKLIILLSLLDTQFPELKICALDFKTTASCRCILWEHSHLGAFGLSTEVATEA